MSANIMFPLYGVAHAIISVWLIKMMVERKLPFVGFYVLVGVTLIYDNWMIAFGHLLCQTSSNFLSTAIGQWARTHRQPDCTEIRSTVHSKKL